MAEEKEKRTTELPVKRIIALAVVGVLCVLATYQGLVEKKVPVEFMGNAGTIIGYYFGYGKGQTDGK